MDRIVLLRASDPHRAVVGQATYLPEPQTLTVVETPVLVTARSARTGFRRLVAAVCAADHPWQVITFECGGRSFLIHPLWHRAVSRGALARAYQAIWANAEIYRKLFSLEESLVLVSNLESGLALSDAAGTICALIGGFPVVRAGDDVLSCLVGPAATATYLAEWGLVDSTPASPYRGLGLGSFLLTLYLSTLVAAGQSEVVLVTAEEGYNGAQRNPARALYEAHGFTVCRDATGAPLRRAVTQLRLDGRIGTHTSIYYHATARTIRAAVGPPAGPIDGIEFDGVRHAR